MMEFHHVMDIHNFIWFVKSLAVLTTSDTRWAWLSHYLWPALPPSPLSLPAWAQPSTSFSRWGAYRLWEPAATAPRQLVPTSRRGCTTTSAAPTARRSSHCSRTPSSATATPPPYNVSVLQQPSHLQIVVQYCCKGNFPASTTEKVKVYTHKIVWHYKSCKWFLRILQLLTRLKCSKKWKC